MPDHDDAEFLKRLIADDEQAKEDLLKKYWAPLEAFVGSQLPKDVQSRLGSDDVTQEVFIGFLKHLPSGMYHLDSHAGLVGLLGTIAKHKVIAKCREHHAASRDTRRERCSLDRREAPESALADAHPGPVQCASERDDVLEATKSLPADEREIVQHRLQGYTVEEISQMTGKSPRTINRILAAVKRSDGNGTEKQRPT